MARRVSPGFSFHSLPPFFLSLLLPAFAVVDVFIAKAEMNRTLGTPNEVRYMEKGVVDSYATQFPYRVTESLSDLRFSWRSHSEKPIAYRMRVDSTDMQVVARLGVPDSGYVPTRLQEFWVEYRCAGSRAGQFEVVLTVKFTLPNGNETSLKLRQEKLCSLKDRFGSHSNYPTEGQTAGADTVATSLVLYILLGGGAFFLLVVLFLLFIFFRDSQKSGVEAGSRRPSTAIISTPFKQKLSSSFRASFHSRQPFVTSTPVKSNSSSRLLLPIAPSSSPIHERPRTLDVKKALIELYADRNLFQILPVGELEGKFGEVRFAIWRQNACGVSGDIDEEEDAASAEEAVLVKSLKQSASRAEFEKFLEESLHLHGVPGHANLAQVAAAASYGRFENPETVTDFPLFAYKHRGFGNLKSFLLSCRSSDKGGKKSKGGLLTLRPHDVLSVAVQILRAVEHLHRHAVLHKDIAARNCLVSEQPSGGVGRLLVQLGDSALSRDLFPNDYAENNGDLRPIRWLPPESLRGGVYSSATDIWSFGVFLWELATGGEEPWAEMESADSNLAGSSRLSSESSCLLSLLETGSRLPQPVQTPDPLYDQMLSCWEARPRERPHSTQLVAALSQLQKQLNKYI